MPNEDKPFCGGALISEKYDCRLILKKYNKNDYLIPCRHVLTAAHCFFDNSGNLKVINAFVTLGLNNVRKDHQATKVRIANVTQHPDRLINLYLINVNDVAVLDLESSVTFTDRVQPVCLSENGR